MLDTKTLIFIMALGNFAFAMMVWIYLRSQINDSPYLRQWRTAKLILGAGFLLVWLRPFLPPLFHPFGSLLLPLGIAFELSAYWGFFGRGHWRRLPWVVAPPVMLALLIAMFSDPTRNAVVVCTSISLSMMYAAMAYLMLNADKQNRALINTIGVIDMIASLVLLLRAIIALFDSTLVPYANAYANISLYLTAYTVLLANGFGFLLLVKQQDDQVLQESHEELAQAESRERELLAIVSHEFRTPAAMIKASLDSLDLLAVHFSPEAMKRLDNMRHASNRLNDMTNMLLLRDRLRERALKPQMAIIDLKSFTSNVLAAYPTEYVRSADDWPAEEVIVHGDPALLRVVLHNLIDNAIGHNPEGMTILVSVLLNGSIVEVRVTDTGNGIPDALKDKIFERFVSGKNKLASGLGLTIVRTIANLHSGHVYVLDNIPSGAIMVFSLPRQHAQHTEIGKELV